MEFWITNKTVPPKSAHVKEAVSALFLPFTVNIFQEENARKEQRLQKLWSSMSVLYTAPEDHGKDVEPPHADVFNSIHNAKCWNTANLVFSNNYESSVVIWVMDAEQGMCCSFSFVS